MAPGRPASAVPLGYLVRALSQAETAAEVARVIAEAGAVAAAAEFANIAMVNPDAERPGTALLFHASSLEASVAQRYAVIPLDDSTPLGVVMRSGGEVWLGSLPDIGARYPILLADTAASGLAATASLALPGPGGRVVGAMGVGWARPQAFTEADKDEVRVVARLAADALRPGAAAGGRALVPRAGRAAAADDDRPGGLRLAGRGDRGRRRPGAALRCVRGLAGPARRAAPRVADHAGGGRAARSGPGRVGVAGAAPAVALARGGRDVRAGLPAVPRGPRGPLPGRPRPARAARSPGLDRVAAAHRRTHPGGLDAGLPRPHPLDDGRDQLILSALGSAVADALSRAIRHDADRDVVLSVQRSLLPKTLPAHPRVVLGAYYAPAERHYGIGGDWYDAMLLPSGQILLIVGDVAGHGLNAAITMGQLQSAARALGPTHGPAALLDALDQFTVGMPDMLSVTAAVVVIDPAQRTLRYSLAGHPPLLLRAPDRSVAVLSEARGPIVGFGVTGRPERTVPFQAGSCLVLFTDGLVERRGEIIDTGFARLSATLAAATADDPAGLCRALTDESLPDAGRDDDTAVLAAFLA